MKFRCDKCGNEWTQEVGCPACGSDAEERRIDQMPVNEAMTAEVITVRTDTRIRDVMKIIREKDLNALPVVDMNGELAGIVSQKELMLRDEWFDALWNSTYSDRSFINAIVRRISSTVDKVMIRDVITVEGTDKVCRAAEIMIDAHKNQLPVVEGRKVVGIITRRDILKLMTGDRYADKS
jgi:CBS domain-containing protein